MDSDGYYYNTNNDNTGIQRNSPTFWAIAIAIQIFGCIIIYGFIRCCCGTALTRTRPGMVFQGNPLADVPGVMPAIPMPYSPPVQPVQPVPMHNYQPAPPAYTAKDAGDNALFEQAARV